MKRIPLPAIVLLAGFLPLAACGNAPSDDAAREAERGAEREAGHEAERAVSVLGVEMAEIERDVRRELATGNIDFGGHHSGDGDSNRGGDAEITPAGDLLIDGERIEVDAREREMLLAYRERITDVALAGASIGVQGAKLATTAMGEAFRGVLSGDTEAMEAKIEAEAAGIQAQVVILCDQLGPLLESQQAIAASIPELAPYATMTRQDVDECYDEQKEIN